jgi:hypothetical protein
MEIDCRNAKERRDYCMKVGHGELAKHANATLAHYQQEINLLRKQIVSLETRLSGKKRKTSL